MLVFFIHGVATRTVQYADDLKDLLKKEFTRRGEALPHFRASFWGNILNDVNHMWNLVHQDLQEFKKEHPQADINDVFRYRKFREGFLSQFMGDVLTYLNSECGAKIRKLLAQELYELIQKYPEETELHIIAHSLGSVILWDILFSDRFGVQEPGFRKLINGLSNSSDIRKVNLKSITTIGSPILFLNTMLAVKSEKVRNFANSYQDEPLKWINIIHASDIIAYPLRASLNLKPSDKLVFRDEYISDDANTLEKAARTMGQLEVAMGLGADDAHKSYFKCQKTTHLIANTILGEEKHLESGESLMQAAINRLSRVCGMTMKLIKLTHLSPVDDTLAELKFKDGSGTLRYLVNPLKVHHVYVFDSKDCCKFCGYVGWLDTKALKEEIDSIKMSFCE